MARPKATSKNLIVLAVADLDEEMAPVSAAAPLPVSVQSGGTSGTQYTEDAAAAANPVGNALILVRRDTLTAAEVTTDGDNVAAKGTSKGQLHVYAEVPASENHLGEVGSPADLIAVTPAVQAAAYAAGEVLFITTAITNAMRVNGGRGILQSVTVIDGGDQKVEMDLVLLGANSSLGTINSAPDIDDTEVLDVLGIIKIGDATNWPWVDLGANAVATRTGIGLLVEAGAGSRDLYVAGITRGAPTPASTTDYKILFGFVQG